MISYLKKLWADFILWLRRRGIKLSDELFQDQSDIPPSMHNWMRLRAFQGLQRPCQREISGDSITHGAEGLIDSEFPNQFYNSAIGGQKLLWIAQNCLFLLTSGANRILFSGGGNDILGGREVDDVIKSLKEIHKQIKHQIPRIGLFEILPLGDKAVWPDALKRVNNPANVWASIKEAVEIKIPEFNRKIRELDFIDVVPVYSSLNRGDGWIKTEYGAGDLIHVSEKAYRDVYLPAIKDYFKI